MNIVNKVTLRQLWLNKRRTLVTLIGTIISVAMITAVATLGVSFMDMMKRQAIATEGEWHVLYHGVNQDQLDAIKADSNTKTVILSRDTGYAYLEGSQNPGKPYLFIKEYHSAAFSHFPIVLAEGRFPQQPDEIVLSNAIASNGKVQFKIGDKITLDIGKRRSESVPVELGQTDPLIRDGNEIAESLIIERTKTYTVVGFIERPDFEPTWAPGYTAISYVDESSAASEEGINASVILKKVTRDIYKHGDSLAASLRIKQVSYNNGLLRYYGVFKDDSIQETLYILTSIIMSIIVAGSIALIYNSFAISVAERSRHLGMLSSVGATKKQKRNSVFFEGLIIGIISIPVGIASGFAGIGITFLCINPAIKGVLGVSQDFRVVVLPSTIILAALISAATILISTYIPAKRASSISAIDAIRQTADIKIKGKQVKTSALTRKIFGIEGELGLKNLKRNRGRYKATVVSLAISMILFLSVSYFTSNLKRALMLTQDGINFDMMITMYGDNDEAKKRVADSIFSLGNITQSAQIMTLDVITYVDSSAVADYIRENRGNVPENEKHPYFPVITALDDEALRSYAKEVGADFETLKRTDKISAILINTIRFKDQAAGKYVEIEAIKAKVGEKLDLRYFDHQKDEEVPAGQVEIAALTGIMPMGVMPRGQSSNIDLIVSYDAMNALLEGRESLKELVSTRIYLNSDAPLKLQEKIEEIQASTADANIYVYNVYIARQREQQMILLMSVFVYGFVTLITAICIANILNTISTSIALRKREFAMLKSVGMTPESFSRMINYESIFYGIKALTYGLPLSVGIMYLIYRSMMREFSFGFIFPWMNVAITILAVFVLVGIAMLYSSAKVKKENIIDVLKQEII